MAPGEQMVYNGKALVMLGPNEEDWWIGKATWECKPSGFTRRGGGGNFANAWATGYDYFRVSVDVATLTRVDHVYLFNLPYAACSHRIRYQVSQVPVLPAAPTITLDETCADIDWFTAFGHDEGEAWSMLTRVDVAPADGSEFQPTVNDATFDDTMAGEYVRMRYLIDSTNGECAVMPTDHIPDEIPLIVFTSEYVEGQGQNEEVPHGELWEISAAVITNDSVLRGGGDAQGAEGDASTLVFNVQSTGVITHNRF